MRPVDHLSSQERILRTLRGQPVDRVPIFAPIPWNPLSPEPPPEDWKALPNYRQLVTLAATHCDFFAQLDIPERTPFRNCQPRYGMQGVPEGIFDRRFFLAPPDRVEVAGEEIQGATRLIHYRVHTPGGILTTTDAIRPGEDTVWEHEPLVQDRDDAERLLALAARFDPPDLTSYLAARERLGTRGVAVCFVSSPIVMVSRLTGFQRFLEWTLTEADLLDRMLRTIQERIAERLQYVLEHGAGPIFRFGGSEQATPPMMSPRFFDRYVLTYEQPLWQLVRDAGQGVWVHCHGRVSSAIAKFRDAGVAMLDPVEPPPQGDMEFAEAKARARRGPMTLVGNVEFSALQNDTPEQIERQVQRAICDGGSPYTILAASAEAISAVDDRLRDNIIRFVQAGHKYGICVGGRVAGE